MIKAGNFIAVYIRYKQTNKKSILGKKFRQEIATAKYRNFLLTLVLSTMIILVATPVVYAESIKNQRRIKSSLNNRLQKVQLDSGSTLGLGPNAYKNLPFEPPD